MRIFRSMKRTYAVVILAIVALLIWIAQKTSIAFLTPNQTDFVGGLVVGLLIAGAIAWWAETAGTTTRS